MSQYTQTERNEMIDILVDDMDSWDLETLVSWAKDARYDMLKGVDDDSIAAEYNELHPQ